MHFSNEHNKAAMEHLAIYLQYFYHRFLDWSKMVFVGNATNYHKKKRHSIFVKIYANTISGTNSHQIYIYQKIETNFKESLLSF